MRDIVSALVLEDDVAVKYVSSAYSTSNTIATLAFASESWGSSERVGLFESAASGRWSAVVR